MKHKLLDYILKEEKKKLRKMACVATICSVQDKMQSGETMLVIFINQNHQGLIYFHQNFAIIVAYNCHYSCHYSCNRL